MAEVVGADQQHDAFRRRPVEIAVIEAQNLGVRHIRADHDTVMGEFVDDDQLGTAAERRIEIELLDLLALIVHDAARQDFEIARQRLRLGAAMSFDITDSSVRGSGAAGG